MNQDKIVMIYGEDPVDGQVLNGKIERLGKINDDGFHMYYFKEFCKNHFLDIKAFQNLTYTSSIDIVAYLLSQVMGHIVFLNTTKDKEKYGYSGLFLMPKEITEKQQENLDILLKELINYNVKICYDMTLMGTIIEAKTIQTTSSKDTKKLVKDFIEGKKNNRVR